MVHCVEQLILVDEFADSEIHQAEKADKPRAWEDAVNGAKDENEDRLRDRMAVAESGRLRQIGVVAWRPRREEVDWVHRNATKLQQPEREEAYSLKDDKVSVERGERFQRLGKRKGDRRGILKCIPDIFHEAVKRRSSTEDGEDKKKVEERKEEVLRDNRQLNITPGHHPLHVRKPWQRSVD